MRPGIENNSGIIGKSCRPAALRAPPRLMSHASTCFFYTQNGTVECLWVHRRSGRRNEAHDSSSEGTTRVVSLLHRLRAPKPAEFSRKRVIDRNPPPKGKRRARASDPKSVSKNCVEIQLENNWRIIGAYVRIIGGIYEN